MSGLNSGTRPARTSNFRIEQLRHAPAGLRIDCGQRKAWVGRQPVALTALQFDVLCLLLERRGQVITFDELSTEVWGYPTLGRHGHVDTTVWRLRRTLRDAGVETLIESVRAVGYTITAEPGIPSSDPGEPEEAYELLQTGILIIDAGGRIRSANRAFTKFIGYELAELTSFPSYAVLAPGVHAAEYGAEVDKVLSGRACVWRDLPLRHRDGHLVEAEACAEPLVEDGRITAAVVEIRPVPVSAAAPPVDTERSLFVRHS